MGDDVVWKEENDDSLEAIGGKSLLEVGMPKTLPW